MCGKGKATADMQYNCDSGAKKFLQEISFIQHNAHIHKKMELYKCTECSQTFFRNE